MLNLGTKKHRDKYFEGIDNVEYPGCFAMTELHHGRFHLAPKSQTILQTCLTTSDTSHILWVFVNLLHLVIEANSICIKL